MTQKKTAPTWQSRDIEIQENRNLSAKCLSPVNTNFGIYSFIRACQRLLLLWVDTYHQLHLHFSVGNVLAEGNTSLERQKTTKIDYYSYRKYN